MAKQKAGELIVGFEYALLDEKVAKQAREAAERIRDRVKRTLEDIIGVGEELVKVKESLEHGQFGAWLRGEFGWTVRTAQNYMAVAEQFGPKSETVSHLMAPTAAYLLAAPSTPEDARKEAIKLAEKGDTVTPKVAKELVAKARKKGKKHEPRSLPQDKLTDRLQAILERYRDRWTPGELHVLAEKLTEFAKSLKDGHSKKDRQK